MLTCYTFRYFQKLLHLMLINSIICVMQAFYYFPATIKLYRETRNWTIWKHISTTSLGVPLYFVISSHLVIHFSLSCFLTSQFDTRYHPRSCFTSHPRCRCTPKVRALIAKNLREHSICSFFDVTTKWSAFFEKNPYVLLSTNLDSY